MTRPHDKNLKLFITNHEIQFLVQGLASQINEYYKNISEELIAVVTLKGALFFASDLLKHIEVPMLIDFVRVKSYGTQTESSGKIEILKDVEEDISGRHILILDEILDTGLTASFLINRFKLQAASVKFCTLLNKPLRRRVVVEPDFCGKTIDDKFVVGYGLDFNERYRHLKDIFILES